MSLRTLIAIIFGLVTLVQTAAQAQGTPPAGTKIPWKLTVVLLDGSNQKKHGEIPVKEAVEFIEKRSRFKFEVEYVKEESKHTYSTYYVGPDRNRDGRGDNKVYLMLAGDLPAPSIESLPISTSYLFLYKLKGRRPMMAGSSMALDYGIRKGGKLRSWATVPVDQPWYIHIPAGGFKSWAAQIVTHEIINTIQAKLEAAPYNCGQLTGTPNIRSDKHEAERLTNITQACYAKLTSENRIDASQSLNDSLEKALFGRPNGNSARPGLR